MIPVCRWSGLQAALARPLYRPGALPAELPWAFRQVGPLLFRPRRLLLQVHRQISLLLSQPFLLRVGLCSRTSCLFSPCPPQKPPTERRSSLDCRGRKISFRRKIWLPSFRRLRPAVLPPSLAILFSFQLARPPSSQHRQAWIRSPSLVSVLVAGALVFGASLFGAVSSFNPTFIFGNRSLWSS